MKKILIVVTGLLFYVTSLNIAFAAGEKTGSVDVGELFDEYEKTKEYSKGLEQKAGSYEKERDVKISEIKQLQDKLNLLTEAEKEKQQKDLEDKVKAARDFTLTRETDLKKEGDDRLKEVAKDIEEATAQFAKKEGYTMIFNDRVFAYTNKANDVTDKVLEMLQANYKKTKAPAGK